MRCAVLDNGGSMDRANAGHVHKARNGGGVEVGTQFNHAVFNDFFKRRLEVLRRKRVLIHADTQVLRLHLRMCYDLRVEALLAGSCGPHLDELRKRILQAASQRHGTPPRRRQKRKISLAEWRHAVARGAALGNNRIRRLEMYW